MNPKTLVREKLLNKLSDRIGIQGQGFIVAVIDGNIVGGQESEVNAAINGAKVGHRIIATSNSSEEAQEFFEKCFEAVAGCWSFPKTEEGIEELSKLMEKPLPCRVAPDKLYSVLGDDMLFDNIEACDGDEDARPLVRERLSEILEHNPDLAVPKLKEIATAAISPKIDTFRDALELIQK